MDLRVAEWAKDDAFFHLETAFSLQAACVFSEDQLTECEKE
jgi:hypothetical protein